MSEQDQSQNEIRARRPQQRPRPAQPRPRQSDEARRQEWLGYSVLGIGALTFITVMIMAFTGGIDTGGPDPDPAVTQSLQQDLQGGGAVQTRAAPAKPVLKREKKISASSLEGGWQASIGEYVAVMEVKGGAFQIILARGEQNYPRLYSSGTYEMLDDIVILRPRRDWKAPRVPAGSSVRYERLTSGRYPMIVGFQRGAMIWQNVPPGERRIYVPPRSPLLLSGDLDYIVWKKM